MFKSNETDGNRPEAVDLLPVVPAVFNRREAEDLTWRRAYSAQRSRRAAQFGRPRRQSMRGSLQFICVTAPLRKSLSLHLRTRRKATGLRPSGCSNPVLKGEGDPLLRTR